MVVQTMSFHLDMHTLCIRAIYQPNSTGARESGGGCTTHFVGESPVLTPVFAHMKPPAFTKLFVCETRNRRQSSWFHSLHRSAADT